MARSNEACDTLGHQLYDYPMKHAKPRTRLDLTNLKKAGKLTGYFGKLPRGRPPKDTSGNQKGSGKQNRPAELSMSSPAKKATTGVGKQRGTYMSARKNVNFQKIVAAAAGKKSIDGALGDMVGQEGVVGEFVQKSEHAT
jgi:hypothetical protein